METVDSNINQEKVKEEERFYLFIIGMLQKLKVEKQKGVRLFVETGDGIFNEALITITDVTLSTNEATYIPTNDFNQSKTSQNLFKKISFILLFNRLKPE